MQFNQGLILRIRDRTSPGKRRSPTSLAWSHSFSTLVTGANSPARLAILPSKDTASRPESFACSAASNRALVRRIGESPEPESWEDQRRERENGEEHEPECAAREKNKTGERNLSGRRTRLHRSSILEDGKREECTGSFAVIYLTVRVKATAIILSSDLFFLVLLPSALMHSPPCAFRLR